MGEQSQTKPRVLQVVRPATGGIRRHISLLCRGLSERGVSAEAAVAPGFTLQGAESVKVHAVPIGGKHHLVRDVRAAISVAHLSRHFDLVHGHGMRGAWICYLASRRTGKAFVYTAHNLSPVMTGKLAPRLVRSTARAAAARIAVSNAVAESYAPLGFHRNEWLVIPNGVDLAAFEDIPHQDSVLRSLGIPEGAKVVGAVGRLAPEKGFDRYLRAAAMVLEEVPGARFVLAGDGPERRNLETLAQPLGERLVMTGGYDAIYGLLSAVDVVVVPSVLEGQGIVAIEAMAAGRAVVASRVGGLAETVLDGVTGILVPPESEQDLARAIVALLRDPALRGRLGAAGRARAADRYSAARMIDSTVEVYRSVASAGP